MLEEALADQRIAAVPPHRMEETDDPIVAPAARQLQRDGVFHGHPQALLRRVRQDDRALRIQLRVEPLRIVGAAQPPELREPVRPDSVDHGDILGAVGHGHGGQSVQTEHAAHAVHGVGAPHGRPVHVPRPQLHVIAHVSMGSGQAVHDATADGVDHQHAADADRQQGDTVVRMLIAAQVRGGHIAHGPWQEPSRPRQRSDGAGQDQRCQPDDADHTGDDAGDSGEQRRSERRHDQGQHHQDGAHHRARADRPLPRLVFPQNERLNRYARRAGDRDSRTRQRQPHGYQYGRFQLHGGEFDPCAVLGEPGRRRPAGDHVQRADTQHTARHSPAQPYSADSRNNTTLVSPPRGADAAKRADHRQPLGGDHLERGVLDETRSQQHQHQHDLQGNGDLSGPFPRLARGDALSHPVAVAPSAMAMLRQRLLPAPVLKISGRSDHRRDPCLAPDLHGAPRPHSTHDSMDVMQPLNQKSDVCAVRDLIFVVVVQNWHHLVINIRDQFRCLI